MSSLMQFNGLITKKGVHLQMYQTTPDNRYPTLESCGDITDCIYLPKGKCYSRIWTFIRKPKGMFGCWVVFRFNNKDQVPDLSCPMGLFNRPKDARLLTISETIKIWQS